MKLNDRDYTFTFPEFLVKTGNPAYSEDPIWPYPYRFYAVEAPDNRYATLLPLIDSLENLFDQIIYLGPLRDNPRPHYNWRGKPPQGVGQHGKNGLRAVFIATTILGS